MRYILFTLAVLLMLGCKKTTSPKALTVNINNCMQLQIDNALSKPKGYTFYQVDAYEYNAAVVYLYYAGCCDRYNDLKDDSCNYLFSPSGGLIGGGDRTHPNFFTGAKFIKTVWTDPRP